MTKSTYPTRNLGSSISGSVQFPRPTLVLNVKNGGEGGDTAVQGQLRKGQKRWEKKFQSVKKEKRSVMESLREPKMMPESVAEQYLWR